VVFIYDFTINTCTLERESHWYWYQWKCYQKHSSFTWKHKKSSKNKFCPPLFFSFLFSHLFRLFQHERTATRRKISVALYFCTISQSLYQSNPAQSSSTHGMLVRSCGKANTSGHGLNRTTARSQSRSLTVTCARSFNASDFVRPHILDLAPYKPIFPLEVLSGESQVFFTKKQHVLPWAHRAAWNSGPEHNQTRRQWKSVRAASRFAQINRQRLKL